MSEQTSKGTAVRPQDDLFGHVNGPWLDSAEIPADLPTAGAFVDLLLDAERESRRHPGRGGRAVRGGRTPRRAPRSRRSATSSPASWTRTASRRSALSRCATTWPPSTRSPTLSELRPAARAASSGRRRRDGGRARRHRRPGLRPLRRQRLAKAGSACPTSPTTARTLSPRCAASTSTHVAAHARARSGATTTRAADAAERIMALETRLASGHWDRVASRDVVEDLQPDDPRRAGRRGTGVRLDGVDARDAAHRRRRSTEVVVRQPSLPRARSPEALADVPLEDWKAWLRWQLVHDRGAVPEHGVRRARTSTSTAARCRGRSRCASAGSVACRSPSGARRGRRRAVRRRHFPPESKAAMDDAGRQPGRGLPPRHRAARLDGPGDAAAGARRSSTTFRPKIGYPDTLARLLGARRSTATT